MSENGCERVTLTLSAHTSPPPSEGMGEVNNMKNCLIYNFAQHYRTNIFALMDREMDIEFVFGDSYLNVKKMDYGVLQHRVREVRNVRLGPVMWQRGVVGLAFKGYDNYIVLGDPACLSTWVLLLLVRLMGKRLFFWTHGWYGKESRLRAAVKRVFFGLATGVMTYGDYARGLMIKEGMQGEKIRAIYNSLMYDEQVPIRVSLKRTEIYREWFGNERPTVVFVGRLTQEKKLDQLLRAQRMCRDRGCDFNVALVGDGVVRAALEGLCEDLGLRGSVWFYGECYDERELSQLLYDADLCVAPGNIGLTAMHAMVYGCPCVSHNAFEWQMPEFEAIREGVTGAFFERDDVASLARCIEDWLVTMAGRREVVREACYREIDERWNPHRQIEIMKEFMGL